MQNQPNKSESQQSVDLQAGLQQVQGYITDPQEFLTFATKDKKIKVMDQCNPIWKNVYLKDISLHKKGPIEDQIYSKVDKYYKNIRRGNTLCQIYDKSQINKQQPYSLFFCRRGMKKFYDLEPQYLKIGANLQTNHRLWRKRIFQEIDQQFERGNSSFHLYCLFKENGEHCQISYVKQLNCWLFASKNVTILAKTPLDLQNNYHKERFIWAKLIGNQFFNILETFTEEMKQNFKKDIEGFTLLGEHCGNVEHQHITKYEKVEIIFYGLVKNTGFDHCQPVEECRAFLQKYNLKMSLCKQKKGITDKNTLYSCMFEMLRQIAEGSMQKEGQGSVMYIVNQRENKQRTISMCKLKSCQYLIYRKLREMLKLNTIKQGNTANNYQKYKFQIQSLIKAYFKPPKAIEFYYKLGNKAFRYIQNNSGIDQTYLRYKFADFIKQFQVQIQRAEKDKENSLKKINQIIKRIIIVCLPRLANSFQKYCKMRGFQIDYMYRAGRPLTNTTVHILYMIPRITKLEQNTQIIIAQYTPEQIHQCIEQLKQSKDITKSHLITFIKSDDKEKNIKMLHNKLQAFRLSCIQQKIPFKIVNPSQQSLVSEIQHLTQAKQELQIYPIKQNHKAVKYFLLPLLLPGSGKSTLAKQLIRQNKDSSCKWKIIDTDAIRVQIMEKNNKGKVDLDNEERSKKLFMQAKFKTNQAYQKQLCNEAHTQPFAGNEYVFIDRLFSSQNLQQTINLIRQNVENDSVRIVVLSQVYNSITLNQKLYPYSLNYLLTCLKRCLERENHQTMCTNPEKICKIIINFYNLTSNFNEKAILKLHPGKIRFERFDFTQESQASKYTNQNIKKKIQQCLKTAENEESNVFIQLIQLMYKTIKFEEEEIKPQKNAMFRLELEKRLNQFY